MIRGVVMTTGADARIMTSKTKGAEVDLDTSQTSMAQANGSSPTVENCTADTKRMSRLYSNICQRQDTSHA